jgi:hypothetical protein
MHLFRPTYPEGVKSAQMRGKMPSKISFGKKKLL